MWKLIILGSLIAVPAAADTGASFAPEPSHVPKVCGDVSPLPDGARTVVPAFAASMSAASCIAEHEMNALTITDDDASIAALDVAVQPAIAMYDAVIAQGGPSQKIIALHAKGDLYISLAVRMRDTVPPMDRERHEILEDKLATWLTEADVAFERVVEIGHAHPIMVLTNPVISHDVGTARRAQRPGVAIR